MLKKLSLTICAVLLVGCTNLGSGDLLSKIGIGTPQDNGPIREISTQKDSEFKTNEDTKKQVKTEEKKTVVTEDRNVNSQNINEYLSEIKTNLKNSIKMNDSSVKNSYSVYLGETLVFPLDNENSIKVTSEPRNSNNKLVISDGKAEFRSIYKGEYVLSAYSNGTLSRKINVSVKPKYDFSEKDLYDVITQKSGNLENSITLYKMLFPTGKNIKNVNYTLLKQGYETKNISLMKEALSTMKNDISSYSDDEKATILKAAKLAGTNIFVPSSLSGTENSALKAALEEYNGGSSSLKDEAKESLNNINDGVKDKLKSFLGGNSTASSNSNEGSYYDKAMKLVNSDPKSAIENFKKSLSTEKTQDKKPEIYYNIANAYAKLGNKVEVSKYLRLLKQEFPNNEWAKKAELLTKFIK